MLPATRISLAFILVASLCILFADLSISTLDPWGEIGRFFRGLITPRVHDLSDIMLALGRTVAFALIGVLIASLGGLLLAQLFHSVWVRVFCAFVRGIHELFWALIFSQMFGLSVLTGVLAIAIPYMGICAKVYAETLEENRPAALNVIRHPIGAVSTFFYVRLPDAWVHIRNYTSYRFECALRSSAVLGFIGLPTIGFHLHSEFAQGNYSYAAGLLILLYLLIGTLKFWMRPWILGVLLCLSPLMLGSQGPINVDNVFRFLTQDIVPAPLLNGDFSDPALWSDLWGWLWMLLSDQALPGVVATLVLSQIALVLTGVLALLLFPLVSTRFFSPGLRRMGHVILVVMRSTPEFVFAYLFLLMWGPSMLPAIIALALHNGALIGHLMGRFTSEMPLRKDAPTGLNRYFYEVLPRCYGQFMAYLFYRWEVIVRETAILGILGIMTLGFYVDSAIEELRMDRVVVLILVAVVLNVGVDSLARFIRRGSHLPSRVQFGGQLT